MSANPLKILVVCMGNICRSPTGEAVLRAKAQARGLDVVIDSAGTIGYHTGAKPDERARKAGEARGYDFTGIYSRQVNASDFEAFDYILASDKANLADLLDRCPDKYRNRVSLFLSHGTSPVKEIPDPYYGGNQGFERVLDLIEKASDAVLDLCQSRR
ncbi:low molecular weight phosphotyrosine protein phosphatase [Grimontia hollisae]|uniref:Low molecular weight protein tyrosine phosphatase n=2 Tax=Grimontia hollisae TaxID=673 RepID=D0I6U5_GRIHO|nr:low molecular weight protein-tyrosine-phosphatase [Grimontia hollisae]AMG31455.1 low molecular weight phosphotyrosine protein phosphatase [Grimontia hollisae]EEY72364.1 low molecular weight protein tyrosine phosphatase [Grimontia hollisae CIP 101886]STO45594.1 Low molecular weight protein-tyrosine-phosphatase yfkJ [Grimontia hollisae]STO57948.1 Low molecular weight protein-tyrosine-phosphatase yfkJ [Grimontia hollisae]STQ76459.1 Low molecular weight protein-tyrosine-phosphatase yfkJ [Grimon